MLNAGDQVVLGVGDVDGVVGGVVAVGLGRGLADESLFLLTLVVTTTVATVHERAFSKMLSPPGGRHLIAVGDIAACHLGGSFRGVPIGC